MKVRALLLGVLSCCFFTIAMLPAQGQEMKTRSEIYRVSKANTTTEEGRDRLLGVYAEVKKEFDAQAAKEFAEQKAAFAGLRVRVIDPLNEENDHGKLFLVAYQGTPTVFALPVGDYKKGDRTPPLEVEEAGTHQAKVTRLVDDTGDGSEVKMEEQTGLVSFFGIELDLNGPVEARKKKEVTTTETLKLYHAKVSTDALTAPVQMSKDLFVSNLKNGETYQAVLEEKRRCQGCNGFGRIQNDGTAPKAPDGKMPCRECGSVGKVDWKVSYLVTWVESRGRELP